ncbi:MAG: YicC/YloC family endoribonuclease [Pseudomonadota bacterium]
MLHSMTGFAREALETDFGTLTWEVKAVNHRYLDVQFRLPEELKAEEQAFRQQAGETLRRGKVECSLYFRRAETAQTDLVLNRELVSVLTSKAEELRAASHDYGAVDPVDILRWPGVLQQREIDTGPLFAKAGELLAAALESLGGMRRSEGLRIHAMLSTRCNEIRSIAGSVRTRMPEVLDAVRAKQRERIDKLDVEADPARLEVELALIAQKLDVDEELDRLDSHVTEIADTLERDDAVGRRLDFLMQELNREANTLASKSADAATTRAAVELKVLIEQMREQIQNVE